MSYSVKEIFYTVQGEGAQAGRAAVFLRFSGCNLWSGREADRHSALCSFCDTDFVGTDGVGGGRFGDAGELARFVKAQWTGEGGHPYVVCTGGEPLLQLDGALIGALHEQGFEVAVETNGTILAPPGIDWICVSPKANAQWIQRCGHELKVVFPQPQFDLPQLLTLSFKYFSLQPMDGPLVKENMQATVEYCKAHPRWRVSVQTHKILDIP